MKFKGVIMEIRSNSMVVMTSQCGFEEIKKRNDSVVGMEIEFMAEELLKRKKSFIKPIAAIAAAIILLVMSSVYFLGGLETEAIPVALLTIDINPSIVLEVNSKQEVINIVPLNKEAEIFSDKSLKNKDVKVVFQEIIGMADELGYLADLEENFILLTTIFLEEVDNDFKNIPDNLKKLTEEMSIKSMGSSVIIVTLESDYETYLRAQKEETSVGKMEIFQRLESGEDGIILEELKEKKVKELLKEASKKDHPVFDVHPGNKGEKEHPYLILTQVAKMKKTKKIRVIQCSIPTQAIKMKRNIQCLIPIRVIRVKRNIRYSILTQVTKMKKTKKIRVIQYSIPIQVIRKTSSIQCLIKYLRLIFSKELILVIRIK